MEQDLIYIYDKLTHIQEVLGEVQSDFNMSLTIDGTKDSCSMLIYSHKDIEIEPYTIVYHPKTNNWWVVANDKIERRMNDVGYLYIHNVQLLGAIELMNARDLIDCAFNSNSYTIQEFLDKLFKLSYFERLKNGTWQEIVYNSPQLDLTQKVKFIKTYENYTLLSALRDFLDAYNCCAKLSFQKQTSGTTTYLTHPVITIVSKTGNNSLTSHNMTHFDDIRETRTLNKNSFGSCVVSNAENVISSIPKVFPSVGGVKPASNEYTITQENAVIKLPSNVYKGISLSMVTNNAPLYLFGLQDDNPIPVLAEYPNKVNPFDENSITAMINKFKADVYDIYDEAEELDEYQLFENALDENYDLIKKVILDLCTIKLYDGCAKVDPITGNIVETNNPDLVKVEWYSRGDIEPMLFCDKTTKDSLKKPWCAISWDRGKDEISGFEGFKANTGRRAAITIRNLKYTQLKVDMELAAYGGTTTHYYTIFEFSGGGYTFRIQTPPSSFTMYFLSNFDNQNDGGNNIQWIVEYIPMSDVKIKVDNLRDRNDIQLYNQNGKITDNFALSKLLNSYSKEISSETITRYMLYTNYNSIPQVGSFVNETYVEDNVTKTRTYVINNISYTFAQNESVLNPSDFGYFIECEFTMSQYCSTKSLMVNPNTNIRDYGIPQNYNIKRKQLYRDYYELDYAFDSGTTSSYYMQPYNIFNFGNYPSTLSDLICVMKLRYDHAVSGRTALYYQLETVKYIFDKMLYVMLDFKDNNIIGYGNQNVYSGFEIERIFSNSYDYVNVPISYVDDNGRVREFEILFVDTKNIMKTYDEYLSSQSSVTHYQDYINKANTLYNYSVFIPSEIFSGVYTHGRDTIRINESNYNKDPLEVPVFEYAAQIADTTSVLIGDNILKQYDEDYIYFYCYEMGNNYTQDNVINTIQIRDGVTRLYVDQGVGLTYDHPHKHLKIQIFEELEYDENGDFNYISNQEFVVGKDYAIFRLAYNLKTHEIHEDLMFIIKNVPQSSLSFASIILYPLI